MFRYRASVQCCRYIFRNWVAWLQLLFKNDTKWCSVRQSKCNCDIIIDVAIFSQDSNLTRMAEMEKNNARQTKQMLLKSSFIRKWRGKFFCHREGGNSGSLKLLVLTWCGGRGLIANEKSIGFPPLFPNYHWKLFALFVRIFPPSVKFMLGQAECAQRLIYAAGPSFSHNICLSLTGFHLVPAIVVVNENHFQPRPRCFMT